MEKEIHKIDVIQIKQLKTKSVYVGKVKYSQIKDIVKKTARDDEKSQFQRHLDPKRVDDIKEYLEKIDNKESSIIPFPTPFVLATYNAIEDSDFDFTKPEERKKYLEQANTPDPILEENSIYVNSNSNKMLIVDGQHRFYGIEKFLDEKSNSYNDFELIVTFLIGYDIFEQAEVFANINFSQKPVNRSLYYDIFGTFAEEKNELKFAHNLAVSITKNKSMKNIIRILGTGSGTISLSFFVSTILKHLINKKGNLHSQFLKYKEDKDNDQVLNILSKELGQYFNFFQEKIPEYYPSQMNAMEIFNKFMTKKGLEDFIKEFNKKEAENIDSTLIIKEITKSENTIGKTLKGLSVPNKFYQELKEYFSFEIPYYNSFVYEYTMLKTPGVYSLLRIFNDLYPEISKISNDKEEYYSFLLEKFNMVISHPEIYFTSKKSGGAGIQTNLYKKIYIAVFGENKFNILFNKTNNSILNTIYQDDEIDLLFPKN